MDEFGLHVLRVLFFNHRYGGEKFEQKDAKSAKGGEEDRMNTMDTMGEISSCESCKSCPELFLNGFEVVDVFGQEGVGFLEFFVEARVGGAEGVVVLAGEVVVGPIGAVANVHDEELGGAREVVLARDGFFVGF
jgi:hypothetical protein